MFVGFRLCGLVRYMYLRALLFCCLELSCFGIRVLIFVVMDCVCCSTGSWASSYFVFLSLVFGLIVWFGYLHFSWFWMYLLVCVVW